MAEAGVNIETGESSLNKLERNLELVTDATKISYAKDGNSVTLSGFRNQTSLEPKTLEMDEVAEVFEAIFSGKEDNGWYRLEVGGEEHSVLKESLDLKLAFLAASHKSRNATSI